MACALGNPRQPGRHDPGYRQAEQAEARAFAAQDVDPLDEELGTPPATTPTATVKAGPSGARARAGIERPAGRYPPFGVDTPSATVAASGGPESDDAALFGILWPLEESVKLDSTIDRRTLRLQIARLNQLGYAFDATAQQWNLQLARTAGCLIVCRILRHFIHAGATPMGGSRLFQSRLYHESALLRHIPQKDFRHRTTRLGSADELLLLGHREANQLIDDTMKVERRLLVQQSARERSVQP